MDDLDKQLAELQLINSAELPPNPSTLHGGKKVGPAVPPKPKKQQPLVSFSHLDLFSFYINNCFQVPQSYSVKQTVEPSFSSRLQSSSSNPYYNLPPSNPSAVPFNTYSNVATPDSSLQYTNVWPSSPSSVSSIPRSNLSISSNSSVQNLVPKAYSKPEQHVTYSNIQTSPQTRNRDGLIYTNLIHPSPVYTNGEDLPPPPPPLEYTPCTVNTNFPPPPDELPPPPSPVSSSYSELRRATQPNQDFSSYGMGSQVSSRRSRVRGRFRWGLEGS